jgi:hypothetical protein
MISIILQELRSLLALSAYSKASLKEILDLQAVKHVEKIAIGNKMLILLIGLLSPLIIYHRYSNCLLNTKVLYHKSYT